MSTFLRGKSCGRRYLLICQGCQMWGRGGERGEASHDCEGRREPGGAAEGGTGKVFFSSPFLRYGFERV